jgi:hypothetical protein
MRRMFVLAGALVIVCAGVRPVSAQPNEIAALRAEIAQQQVVIAQLLKRVETLEKQQPPVAAAAEDLREEIKAQQDSLGSLREIVTDRVNLNGYYNFRFFVDGSPDPLAFQQHHLGIILAKQLGRFNFLTEIELQNVPHHAELLPEGDEIQENANDISGEGEVAVENAWMEYNHNRFFGVRVGKQLSPQYWWQHHYPNLTLSTTLPIYLRELFPAEMTGVLVQGSAARTVGASEFGVGYKFYVANNDFEGNTRADLRDGKAWGAQGQVRFPASGAMRRFDVAADVYRGHVGLSTNELVEDNVFGFESQLEVSSFLFQAEWARGKSLEHTRTGFYLQPAYRIDEDWVAFYRVEQLTSARILRAERRHIGGLNYRPYPQIAIKAEIYRSQPLQRDFVHAEDGRNPYNGFAAATVFFF